MILAAEKILTVSRCNKMSGRALFLSPLPVFLNLFPCSWPPCGCPFLLLLHLLFWTPSLPIFRNCLLLRKKIVLCRFNDHFHDWHEMSFLTHFNMTGLLSSVSSVYRKPPWACVKSSSLEPFCITTFFPHCQPIIEPISLFICLCPPLCPFCPAHSTGFKGNCLVYPIAWEIACAQ